MKKEILQITFFSVVLFFSIQVVAQTCPDGSKPSYFAAERDVQITACIQNEVTLGKQSVFWGARNLTNDKLYIKFVKVVYTTCGTVMRENADTYLKPREFVGGTTFSGELTFETQVWKENCKTTKNRISRIAYEGLVIKNLSQEERDREAKRKEDETNRERERIAQEKEEQEKKEAAEKARKAAPSKVEETTKQEERILQEKEQQGKNGTVETVRKTPEQLRQEYQQEQKAKQAEQTEKINSNIASGVSKAAGLQDNVSNNLKDNNFYNETSTSLGVHLGLISPNTPLITEEFTNAGSPKSDVMSPFQAGLNVGLKFYPIVSNYFSLGLVGNFNIALDPLAWLSGSGSSTTSSTVANIDVSSKTSASAVNYDFGGEVGLGLNKLKILGAWYYKNYNLSYNDEIVTDNFSSGSVKTTTISTLGSVDYKAQRIEVGIRIGSYRNTIFDLVYGLESFKDHDGMKKEFPLYKLNIWKFSGLKFFTEYGKGIAYGPVKYMWKDSSNAEKEALYLNVGLIYNIDWLFKW